MKIGIIDLRHDISDEDVDALVTWVISHRLDMLTWSFGSSDNFCDHFCQTVADLGARAHAISWTPLFQRIDRRGESWFYPSFFMFFGCYRAISVKDDEPDPEVPDELQLGADICKEMIHYQNIPRWPRNREGSAFLNNLGHIKMKLPDWTRWFSGCFQTVLWLGTSTPSASSQKKAKEKSEEKGKGKGTWKCTGKGNKFFDCYSI